MTPERVQLRRVAGWRMPPNTRSVARPSRWGNPFRVQREPCITRAGTDRHMITFRGMSDTMAPPEEIVDLDDWFADSDDDLHAECCAKKEFICGHPYHPEAVASKADAETCDECIELLIGGACPTVSHPRHFHCPLIERESGLLTFCRGPKRGRP